MSKPVSGRLQFILRSIALTAIGHPNGRMKDCFAQVGKYLASGRAAEDDAIVLFGTNDVPTHGIIVNNTGDVIVDAYKHALVNFENFVGTYKTNDREVQYKAIYAQPVREFMKIYNKPTFKQFLSTQR